jgi:hypothetical protein
MGGHNHGRADALLRRDDSAKLTALNKALNLSFGARFQSRGFGVRVRIGDMSRKAVSLRRSVHGLPDSASGIAGSQLRHLDPVPQAA